MQVEFGEHAQRCEVLAQRVAPAGEATVLVNQFQPRASLPQKLVQELIDEGLPVLQPYLSSSVKIKESHQQARPMIHLDARHKLTLEMIALHDALAAQAD